MRKNRIVSLIFAVMLTVTVVFSALSTGALAIGAVIDVSSEPELKAALNMKSKVDRINITGDFTVNSDCTIMFDEDHLAYYCDTVMTVAAGVTLTVGYEGVIGSFWPSYEGDWETGDVPNGKLINNGTIVVEYGGTIAAEFDENNGVVLIKEGGDVVCANENHGTVTVLSGGIYETTQGFIAYNDGTINVDNGAMMASQFGCSIVNGENGVINLYGQFNCGCFNTEDEDVMLFENRGKVEGDGMILLCDIGDETKPVNDMDALIEDMMGMLDMESRFDGWDHVGICRLVQIKTFEELVEATTGERIVAGERVAGDMDTVIMLLEDIEIPAGKTVATMAGLIVPVDLRLTVCRGATLECGLQNNGAVEVQSGGTLATTMGAYIINSGVMSIEKDAILISQMGSAFINDAYAGLMLNGTFFCGCLNYGSGDISWFYNYGDVNGTGTIQLYEVEPDDMAVENMEKLVEDVTAMVNNDTLTVQAGEIFTPGDINNDGKVNNKDVVALFRYVSSGTGNVVIAALDTNGDGKLNNKDVVALFRYVSDNNHGISTKPYTPKD